jgi:hypothetical protein
LGGGAVSLVRKCGREKKKWIGQVVKSKESQRKEKKLVPFYKNNY